MNRNEVADILYWKQGAYKNEHKIIMKIMIRWWW